MEIYRAARNMLVRWMCSYSYRPSMGGGSDFLPHLEGLRGVAIMLILLFHLGTTGMYSPVKLPGGYLGVEIFLVLSGYLLVRGFVVKHENFTTFVRKKLLRIMLPVSVVVILTMLSSLFCMDFSDIRQTAENAFYALLAWSNVQLSADGAEYFSADQAYNPLLHMWYVAIIVQSYVLFYVGYLLLWSCPRWLKVTILSIVALLSYVYGHCHSLRAEMISALDLPLWMSLEGTMYYSTFARLWELLLGGAILYIPEWKNRFASSVLCVAALGGIVYSVVFLPDEAMLYAVLASLVLIRFGSVGLGILLLSNKVIRAIGKISFSVYLIHMPLYVLYKCSTYTRLTYCEAVWLVIGAIALGFCFWWLVEKRLFSLWSLLAIWVSAVSCSACLIYSDGLKKCWNASSNSLDYSQYPYWKEEKDKKSYIDLDKDALRDDWGWISLVQAREEEAKKTLKYLLRLGPEDIHPSFVLMGDSHAQHYIMGMDVWCKKNNIAGLYLASTVVPFWNREVPLLARNYFWNRKKAQALMDWLKAHPALKYVCIAQLWGRPDTLSMDWDKKPVPKNFKNNITALTDFCKRLTEIGKKVIIFGPLPYFEEKSPVRYSRYLVRTGRAAADYPHPGCTVTWSRFRKHAMFAYMKEMESKGLFAAVYPHEFLFKNGVASMTGDGQILFKDKNHFSVVGSIMAIESVSDDLKRLLHADSEVGK